MTEQNKAEKVIQDANRAHTKRLKTAEGIAFYLIIFVIGWLALISAKKAIPFQESSTYYTIAIFILVIGPIFACMMRVGHIWNED